MKLTSNTREKNTVPIPINATVNPNVNMDVLPSRKVGKLF